MVSLRKIIPPFALILGVFSCSSAGGISGASSSSKKLNEAAPTNTGTSASTTNATDAGQTTDNSGGDNGAGTGAAPSLDDIIKQCGVDQNALKDPNATLFNSTLNSFPKVYVGVQNEPLIGPVNYRITVKIKMTITATTSKSKQQSDFAVTAEPSQAQSQAEAQVLPNRGYTEATMLTTDERIKLIGGVADWSGIICTVQPVREMDVNKGGKLKHLSFDPPLPDGVSPKAVAARYDAEIGQGKTFSNIKVTVTQSDDPAIPQGTTMMGTVKVSLIDPHLTIQVGDSGPSTTLTADKAYRIDYQFGSSVDDTKRLGLIPSEELFIDSAAKDIKVVVADTGDPNVGQVVLSKDLQ